MNRFLTTERILALAVSVLILIVLLLVLSRVRSDVALPNGGYDFHAYWYQGHTVRHGNNPYRASLEGTRPAPNLPYLDGATQPRVGTLNMSTVVTNTAPLVLLLTGLAFFSWNIAKWLWTGINFIFALCIPWLVLRFFPERAHLSLPTKLLVFLIAYAMVSTRAVLNNGQTTFLAITFTLLALLLRRRAWLIAGVLLGIALSKYSLVLPAVLYLLFEGRARNLLILGSAALVQVLGIVIISQWSGDAPLTIVQQYAALFGTLAQADTEVGVQLSRLVGAGNAAQVVLSLVVSAGLLAGLALWWRAVSNSEDAMRPLLDYAMWVVAILWTMLVFYHGGYDLIVILPVVPLLLLILTRASSMGLGRLDQTLAAFGLLVYVGIFCMPLQGFEFLTKQTGPAGVSLVERIYALGLVVLFGIIILIMTRATHWRALLQPRPASVQFAAATS